MNFRMTQANFEARELKLRAATAENALAAGEVVGELAIGERRQASLGARQA